MPTQSDSDRLHRLISALGAAGEFGDGGTDHELIETHISCIVLSERFAYKFKKALNLGFLDFTTLAQRRFYCGEELRLNRRTAPQLYLDVMAVTGSEEHPRLGGDGDAIEYAVRMRRFDSPARFDRLLESDRLEPAHMEQLAADVAAFHRRAAVAGEDSDFATPGAVRAAVTGNFTAIRPRLEDRGLAQRLDRLQAWSHRSLLALQPSLAARRRDGSVRECHGDLHLENITLYEGRPLLFDCIEFSAGFRWIDVINEIAFLVMDLDARGRPALGRRFLDAWLQCTGDYRGLRLLRFYRVYRALVRCKIACIRQSQPGLLAGDRAAEGDRGRHYLQLAAADSGAGKPLLVITHGLSGCGKTTLTQALVEQAGAIRLRSDVERKRLYGLEAGARSGAGRASGRYSAAATESTYRRLLELAQGLLEDGYPVVVDATFLSRAARAPFLALARHLAVPLVILDIRTPEAVLRPRVSQRAGAGGDASEADLAVLERQIQTREPLAEGEREHALVVDGATATGDDVVRAVGHRLQAPQGP